MYGGVRWIRISYLRSIVSIENKSSFIFQYIEIENCDNDSNQHCLNFQDCTSTIKCRLVFYPGTSFWLRCLNSLSGTQSAYQWLGEKSRFDRNVWLIDFNDISTPQGSFYTKSLVNRAHCTLIFRPALLLWKIVLEWRPGHSLGRYYPSA